MLFTFKDCMLDNHYAWTLMQIINPVTIKLCILIA